MKTIKRILVILIMICSISLNAQSIVDIGGFDKCTTTYDMNEQAQRGPINFMYKYSLVQHIYTKNDLKELPAGGEITKVTVRCKPTDKITEDFKSRVKVYFVETDQEFYAPNKYDEYNYIATDSTNLVCFQELNLNFKKHTLKNEDIEISFNLTKPYKYGGKNLMMMFVQEAPKSIYLNDKKTNFYCFPTDTKEQPIRTLFTVNDRNNFKTPYPKTNYFGYLPQVPVMKIEYKDKPSGINETNLFEKYVSISGKNLSFRKCKSIEIYNTIGQVVAASSGADIDMNIGGIYIVKLIDNNNKIVTGKVIL